MKSELKEEIKKMINLIKLIKIENKRPTNIKCKLAINE